MASEDLSGLKKFVLSISHIIEGKMLGFLLLFFFFFEKATQFGSDNEIL